MNEELTRKPGTVPDDESSDAAEPICGRDVIVNHVVNLPAKPGVYRMINQRGDVLYVGKAKSLKARVNSYTATTGHSNRIMRMIAETAAMEFIVTASETEALLLEANLIKQFKPRYNVLLRDDKSFPFILIAEDHEAPRILKHRGAQSREGSYFGPFASAGAVNHTLNTLQKAFLLRSCSDSDYEARTRPCLLHQIKRCSAPCVGLISTDEYSALVGEAKAFLSGKSVEIQRGYSADMETAAENLDFELAASLRDRIRALSYVQGSQSINTTSVGDADVFAIYDQGPHLCVQVFFIRGGQNWGNHSFFPRHAPDFTPAAALESFIAQFYDSRMPPKSLLVSHDLESIDILAEALSLKANRKVTVAMPRQGEKRSVVDTAQLNAKEALQRKLAESASQRASLEALARALSLDSAPERIEVYDNSHIQGDKAVGAMIVAGPDGFDKGAYRKFNIKSPDATPGDDFAMMREVITRRFSRMLKEENAARPDLVIIDGGKGHLSVVGDVFRELGIDLDTENITVIGVSKARRINEAGDKRIDRTMGTSDDQIIRLGGEPFKLPPRDPGLFFLQRLRDEAHRFAIDAHRAKRKKAVSASPLDEIPGVGAKRKRTLLNHFGSAKAIARAKPEDLAAAPGVSKALAQVIYDYFQGS